MVYQKNDGCGCILAIFLVMFIGSGIRSCTEHLIKGDLKLPRFGSSHVSGGSGGYGTSNGYNIQYNQSTTPNYNSSLNDYSETDNLPTKYKNESKIKNNSNNVLEKTSSKDKQSVAEKISNYTKEHKPIIDNNLKTETYYKTCGNCKGTGLAVETYEHVGLFGEPCKFCHQTDRHSHQEIGRCSLCSGKGEIRMKKISTSKGEFYIPDN